MPRLEAAAMAQHVRMSRERKSGQFSSPADHFEEPGTRHRVRLEQFTYSKVQCWVALDRAIRLATKRSLPLDRARLLAERDRIYEGARLLHPACARQRLDQPECTHIERALAASQPIAGAPTDLIAMHQAVGNQAVMTHGWDAQRRTFVQYFGTDALDAANLIMPLVFFISPNDPRMIGTLNRTIAEDEIDFSTPVSSVSMEMVGFKGSQSTSGVVVPEWSVTAYDANNTVVGTFSEPLLSSFSDIPPTDFTLHGAIGDPITHVVVSGNAENHAAFAPPLFDRIVTT